MAIEDASKGVVIVDLRPEPNTGTELATVASIVQMRGDCDVVVDFANVDIVTSPSLSKLQRLQELLTDCGHQLVLCGLSYDTRAIFTVAGLDRLFEFADDRSFALAAIKRDKQAECRVSEPA